ncbi:MAG: metal ABC transporter permease [Oscillibacter sp.]|jgi:zinc transport system permease protein|nr:metal ABC transporter permease [Oscillibacter sp.]
MTVFEMLSYPFMRRALIAGGLVSLCCALLGVSLVLKRYSMIGDGLSHVSFGALAVAAALGVTPLSFSIPVVVAAAFFLLRMANHPRWNNDAAIAVMSASALAVGILVISLTTGMTTDVDNYMFGSVLAMTKADVGLSAGLSAAVLVLFVLFYHRLFAVTFDENFSRATGLKVDAYNTLLSVLTALAIVLGMRMMGAMLISSLIIFPALTAMRLQKSFLGVVISAGISAVGCFVVGLTASFVLSAPVGATVVAVDLAVFLLACLFRQLKSRGAAGAK